MTVHMRVAAPNRGEKDAAKPALACFRRFKIDPGSRRDCGLVRNDALRRMDFGCQEDDGTVGAVV